MFNLQKNAGIIGAFTKHVVPGAFKGVRGAVRAVGSGLMPTPKGSPVGKRIFGLATKGTAAAGLYMGVRNVSGAVARKSEPTYTTMLRNNVIAGNINRDEVSPADVTAINRQGMR